MTKSIKWTIAKKFCWW